MNVRLPDRNTPRHLVRCASALLLLPFLAPHFAAQTPPPTAVQAAPSTVSQATATAQTQPPKSIGFWDLSDPKLQAMLAAPPSKQEDRYNRLRDYFTTFGCTGNNLTSLTFKKNSHHPALLCTLPGATSRIILIAAWYPRGEIFEGASDGWPDAVMLPMLYHALQAQPRLCTFIFAELSGDSPQPELLDHFRAGDAPLPLAFIHVAALGFGPSEFSTSPDNSQPEHIRPNNKTLHGEAWRILQLQHIDTTHSSVESSFSPTPTLFAPSFAPQGSKGIPSIFIYSSPVVLPGKDAAFSIPAFHRNHDYLAFFLGDIDIKLDGTL
jgi:hypothetical protein